MTLKIRRLIFYGLILVFAIVAPTTILYSAGYSLDWQEKRLVKTGAFYFKSLPKGAKIFMNGELQDTTPALIDRLVPKEYQIKISKDNFFSWSKKLEIKPSLVSEARNILLVPKNPQLNLVSQEATSTKDYFLTPEEKRIYLQAFAAATSTLKDLAGWTVYQNNIYYLQSSNLILYKIDLAGLTKEQISFEPLPISEKSYQIEVRADQISVFEPGGRLYLFNREKKVFEPIAEKTEGLGFSSDNKKLLYWNEHEIWVLWLKDSLIQPYREEGEKELITRYSSKISQAIWLGETHEHIIFTVQINDNGHYAIKITELDGRDMRNSYDIFSAKNPEIYWNEKDDLFYFLTDKKLYSFNLLE